MPDIMPTNNSGKEYLRSQLYAAVDAMIVHLYDKDILPPVAADVRITARHVSIPPIGETSAVKKSGIRVSFLEPGQDTTYLEMVIGAPI